MFVCGDNEWGQTGYQWKRPGGNASSPTFGMSEDDDDETGSASAMEISLREFQAPVLLEGSHVPASVAQVSCGARHTAALAHSGRLYVYGGELLPRIGVRSSGLGFRVFRFRFSGLQVFRCGVA